MESTQAKVPKTVTKSNEPVLSRMAERLSITYYQYAILAAVTLFAFAVRFYKLGEWSFWIDEVLTVNYALGDLSQSLRPSYHLIGLALRIFGVSDWSARLVPAVVGVLSLPILYFPTRKMFGPGVALLAMALLAISPWHLYWSQNARFYTLLMLFYTLGTFAFYQWLETNRFRYLGAAMVLFGLAALERMTTVFFLPVALAYLLALLWLPFGRELRLRARHLILLALPAVLISMLLMFVSGFFDKLSTWIFGRQHDPVRVFLSIIYDIGLPLFLLALLGGIYLLMHKNRPGLYFLLSALIPTLLLVAISPFTQAFSRYVFMTLPAYAILGAVAAKEIFIHIQKPGKILALGMVLVLAADAISQDVLYFTTQNGNRENYKEAYAFVEQHRQAEDWVVTTRFEIANYYLGIQSVDSNRIDLDGIIASGKAAWFVMDNRTHVSEPLAQWIAENTRLVGVYDVYIPGKVMEMRVYYYGPA